MDIIEMDAASNNSVDEIRELRSKINLVPAISKFKVYIIDEVHMLTTSAFNALLKTLEEPPEHVIFILATTELHKIPATILSRCQCFEFGRISNANLLKKLREVSDAENISVDDEVLKEITIYSEGGMRDALGMLDKLASYAKENINLDLFLQLNNLVSNRELEEFIEMILKNSSKYIVDKLLQYEENGIDVLKFVERLIYKTRDIITENYLNKVVDDKTKLLTDLALMFNDCYLKMHNSVSPKTILELEVLLFMSSLDKNKEIGQQRSETKQEEKQIALNKQTFEQKNKEVRINNAFARANKEILKDIKSSWNQSLQEYILSRDYGSIACILMDSTPRVASDEYLIVSVKYESVLENINCGINIFQELIKKLFGKKLKLAILTDEEWNNEKNKFIENKKNNIDYKYQEEIINEEQNDLNYDKINNEGNNALDDIVNIFGEDIVQIEE
jgi:DNA polymerase-3 subunit gamma/tau